MLQASMRTHHIDAASGVMFKFDDISVRVMVRQAESHLETC